TGATGVTGPTGDTGATGVSNSIIAFDTGNSTATSSNAAGASSSIIVSSFGDFSPAFTLTAGTFSFSAGEANSFIMPYDAIIVSIYMSATNLAFTPPTPTNIFPYVAIATAPSGSNTFTIIPSTKTVVSAPYVGGVAYPANTIFSGSLTGLNISVAAGTRVAIVCGFDVTLGNLAASYIFYYTGGILLA
ncbi:hypothetical protein OCE25_28405, partial [Bacillus cereus]|nr:hypothetical protein [Bacillus cereus]